MSRVAARTLKDLEQQSRLGTGGLEEGRSYTVVRASISPGGDGGRGRAGGNGCAHLVLRDLETGQLFLIVPRTEFGTDVQGEAHDWLSLACQLIDPD